jgi:hypothetical protein
LWIKLLNASEVSFAAEIADGVVLIADDIGAVWSGPPLVGG